MNSLRTLTMACVTLFLTHSQLSAANYYFDPSVPMNGGGGIGLWFSNKWATPTNVAPYTQAWDNTAASNNVAFFQPATVLGTHFVDLFGNSVNFGAGGLQWATAAELAIVNQGPTPSDLVFDGGSINAGATNSITTNIRSTIRRISGNFSLTSGNLLVQTSSDYQGTATVNAGSLTFDAGSSISTSSHASINGGQMFFNNAVSNGTFGNLSMASGSVFLQRSAGVTLSGLSGSGGTIQVQNGAGTSAFLTVNQVATGTATYSGNIVGIQNANEGLSFTKSGSGTLVLDGSSVRVHRGTTVNGGTLLINADGSFRDFENFGGTTAVDVASGGTLGGTATFNILSGDNVLVGSGGRLTPGAVAGSAGRTTFNFVSGGGLDLTGATAGSNWLAFDLGAKTTAGTTYDQIRVTGASGSLTIGTGLLGFNDFSFNALSGLEAGTYTLFDSTSLIGSLSGNLSGRINNDYVGSLSVVSNTLRMDVTFDVIPEPSTALLGLVGMGALLGFRRRNKTAR